MHGSMRSVEEESMARKSRVWELPGTVSSLINDFAEGFLKSLFNRGSLQ